MTTLHDHTAPRVTETAISKDRDGDWQVDTGATAIGHYHGDTVEHADLFTIDAPDPMTPAQLAAHIRGAQALLDHIDPNRANRLDDCTAALDHHAEKRAQLAARDYGHDAITAQLAAADTGAWPADPTEIAVWRRALVLSGGAA